MSHRLTKILTRKRSTQTSRHSAKRYKVMFKCIPVWHQKLQVKTFSRVS